MDDADGGAGRATISTLILRSAFARVSKDGRKR